MSCFVYDYIPKLSEQKDLIEELDNLATQTKKLQTHYQQKLNNLEELKSPFCKKHLEGSWRRDNPSWLPFKFKQQFKSFFSSTLEGNHKGLPLRFLYVT